MADEPKYDHHIHRNVYPLREILFDSFDGIEEHFRRMHEMLERDNIRQAGGQKDKE